MSAASPPNPLPREPIHRLTAPLERFLHVEAASGVALALCTIIALVLANSGFSYDYLSVWKTTVGFRFGEFEMYHSLKHWINDGLMAIFFFVIGLEVKREIAMGELKEPRKAILPIAAALGGMVVPAGIYLALAPEASRAGWGIPMATDIAFVVGCIAILGRRIPKGLRVLLLSLAIADDIGAILVIAVGYTEDIQMTALGLGFGGIVLVSLLARLGVRSFGVYLICGALIWLAFHESGVHATIAGVILGLQTPARSYLSQTTVGQALGSAGEIMSGEGWDSVPHRADQVRRMEHIARESISPLEYLEAKLHPWVGFAIMPVFALANAGVPFEPADVANPTAVAVAGGLILGKPIGIFLFSFLAVRLGLASLPKGVGWTALAGAGLLAGIGFTMALFIASLALEGETLDTAKVGVLGGSMVAGLLGVILLVVSLKPPAEGATE